MGSNNTTNVLSIGGNALDSSINLENLLGAIYLLSRQGKLLITHGNGPQVGALAKLENKKLGILTAQSDAEIGIFLQEQLNKYFRKKGLIPKVETILTRVLVDKNDPSFSDPTKPVGPFYKKPQEKELKGHKYKKLIGGYRRVVASPKPKEILNLCAIESLLDAGYIVIAGGGGGIPIFYKDHSFEFADAVIDKDYTTCLIAKQLGAKNLFILTNVDYVYYDFEGKAQRKISRLSASKTKQISKDDAFEQGSIRPKLEAALDFAKATKHNAAIGNIRKAKNVIRFKGCTIITP